MGVGSQGDTVTHLSQEVLAAEVQALSRVGSRIEGRPFELPGFRCCRIDG